MKGKRVVAITLVIGGIAMLGVTRTAIEGQRRVLSATDSLTVEERLASLEKRVSALERQTRKTTSTGAQKTAYYSLTAGTVTSGSWATVSESEFWFDQSLYGNVVSVSWEGWLQNYDGSAVALARLYDITNHRVVDFSEVRLTGKQRASFYSKALAIWRGQNQYRVEVMSTTSNPVAISEARLKIVTQ